MNNLISKHQNDLIIDSNGRKILKTYDEESGFWINIKFSEDGSSCTDEVKKILKEIILNDI